MYTTDSIDIINSTSTISTNQHSSEYVYVLAGVAIFFILLLILLGFCLNKMIPSSRVIKFTVDHKENKFQTKIGSIPT